MRDENARARELLARARGEARLALEQLRRLVRDIHPQVLTDHGLAAAVTEVALRNPIPVTVDIDLPHRLPAPVETTAYFTVTEALANAGKHSGASHITITGRVRDDRLHLAVTDDGRGGADPDSGAGAARARRPRGDPQRPTHRRQPPSGDRPNSGWRFRVPGSSRRGLRAAACRAGRAAHQRRPRGGGRRR
ncbi:hypothetical protein LT493_17120 [Streptomyces tricolor]|nr:hypothetical protein [Streptomyces tricolor]